MWIVWHVRAFLGLGAIFSAMSEFWFYPVTAQSGIWLLVLFYAVAAHSAVLWVARLRGGGWPGTFLMAVLLGFVIEGVPVFELYGAVPFSLVWTSMAWHGLVSGLAGIWLYRWAAARGRGAFVAVNVFFGSALGVWGAYYWASEPPGTDYAAQVPIAFGLFLGGHLILPVGQVPTRFRRVTLAVVTGLVVLGIVAGPVMTVGAATAILVGAIALSLFAVRGVQSDAPIWPVLPFGRLWISAVFPLCAVAAFRLFEGAFWLDEVNALVILLLGPLSVGLFTWCVVRAIK